MTFRLEGKVAIVYGGSYGIGKGISEVLANSGAKVVVVARNKEKGETAIADLSSDGHIFVQGDVKEYTAHERIVKEVIDKLSQIDIIVCCAGTFNPTYKIEDEEYNDEHISQMIDINVKGSIFAVKACVPHLKKSKAGRIILISSITGQFTGFSTFTVYGATKSAQVGFAHSAAVELAPYKITVNCVLPGNILTDGLKEMSHDYLDGMRKSVPLDRLGIPKDVAYAVLYLASEEASFVTGQEIVVDGGQTRPED